MNGRRAHDLRASGSRLSAIGAAAWLALGISAAAQAGLTDAAAAEASTPGSVVLDKPAQRRLGLRTVTVASLAAASIAVPGRIVADPMRTQRIAATQPGTIEPLPGHDLPAAGTTVVAGQVLARLRPVLPQPDRRDLDTDLAEADRDTKIGELQIERFQIDDTNHFDVKLPTPTLQILTDYHAAKTRQAALKETLHEPLPLIARQAGRVLRSSATAGRLVAEGETLFEISTAPGPADADASQRRSAADSVDAPAVIEAEFIDTPLDAARATQALTRNGQSLTVQVIGNTVFDAGTRSYRTRYAITSAAAPVAINTPVTVFMPKARGASEAVAIPSAAVRRGAAGACVWLHTQAERFVAQPVVVLSDDGETASVRADWPSADARLVVQGSAVLSLAASGLALR